MYHLAQVTPIAPPLNYTTATTGVQFLQNFLTAFLIMSFIIGILVFFFVFISGGIDFITSGGDKANTEKAKNKITNSLVGLFILLSLYAFLDLFIYRIFGFYAQSFHIGQLNIHFNPPPPYPTGGSGGTPTPGSGGTPTPGSGGTPTPTGLPNGALCSFDSWCASGYCNSDTDNDYDNYHLHDLPTRCDRNPPDCNDNDANVHPNQSGYFIVPIPGTTNDFNYDCADSNGDGDPNDKQPSLSCIATISTASCQTTPFPNSMASGAGWVGSAPPCGRPLTQPGYTFRYCRASSGNSCSLFDNAWQGCSVPEFCYTVGAQSWNIVDGSAAYYPLGTFTAMPCK